ncbi:Crp/Fnr family transcriptional regulator [Capnocytophaga canis]
MQDVMIKYLSFVKTLCPKLTEEDLCYFAKGLSIETLHLKDFYIKADEEQNQIGFVAEGLLRGFYIDEQGNDITVSFHQEEIFVADYTTLDSPRRSRFYFQCLEKTTIINHSYEHLRKCSDKIPFFERYMRLVAENAFKRVYRRVESFLFNDAETRYLDLMKENPELVNRVSVSHLCSYLGISRQALTRIRKNILNKE